MRDQAARKMIEAAPDPGMRLAPITEEARKKYGLDPALRGALVTAVESDSEAGDLGIVPGDVIINAQGQSVATPDDVRQAIETAHKARREYLALLVQTKTDAHWVPLSITNPKS